MTTTGKPMSWTDIAKALAPSGAGILTGLAIHKGIANRRAAAQQAVQQAAQQAAQQNAQAAAAQTTHSGPATQFLCPRSARTSDMR